MKAHLKAPFLLLIFLLVLSGIFLPPNLSGQDVLDNPQGLNKETPVSFGNSAEATKEESAKTPEAGSASQELITVNFENTDILEVIRILSEKSGLNIVAGPDVKATVTLQLVDVPWDKALDVILRNYNLTYKREPGLIRVMTLDQLKLEEEKVPLSTRVLKMNFARVEVVKSSFNSMLSPRGKIDIDVRTNSLLVTDLPENIAKIESMVNQLDTRTPQVVIEAMLADVKITSDDELGVQWKWARNANWTTGRSGKTIVETTSALLPSNTAAAITFGQTILKNTDFTALIKMWQEQQRVNILAHPVIMTLDNQTAHIELSEEIPYQQQTSSTQSASGLTTTAFKDSGIKLDVTPHITSKDNFVSMNLKVEHSFLSGFTPDNQPIVDGRKAETNLLVKNGETIVIGGLRKKEDTFTIDKVPFFGDIPLFGILFRKKVRTVSDIDLLIFVTPKVIEETVLTEKEAKRLELFTPTPQEEKEKSQFERLDWKPGKPAKAQSGDKLKKEEIFTLRPPS